MNISQHLITYLEPNWHKRNTKSYDWTHHFYKKWNFFGVLILKGIDNKPNIDAREETILSSITAWIL